MLHTKSQNKNKNCDNQKVYKMEVSKFYPKKKKLKRENEQTKENKSNL